MFYGISNSGVFAASQFDQVHKHPWFAGNLKLRKDVVKEYFGFGFMMAPNTVYDNIFLPSLSDWIYWLKLNEPLLFCC